MQIFEFSILAAQMRGLYALLHLIGVLISCLRFEAIY